MEWKFVSLTAAYCVLSRYRNVHVRELHAQPQNMLTKEIVLYARRQTNLTLIVPENLDPGLET